MTLTVVGLAFDRTCVGFTFITPPVATSNYHLNDFSIPSACVHLVREFPREASAEQILLGIEAKFGIKTAYGWVGGQRRALKRIRDAQIVEPGTGNVVT